MFYDRIIIRQKHKPKTKAFLWIIFTKHKQGLHTFVYTNKKYFIEVRSWSWGFQVHQDLQAGLCINGEGEGNSTMPWTQSNVKLGSKQFMSKFPSASSCNHVIDQITHLFMQYWREIIAGNYAYSIVRTNSDAASKLVRGWGWFG